MALSSAQLATARQLVGFLSPPLPLNSAFAVCGNVGQECAFNPTLSGDAGASKYWMQWQGSRLTAYEAWCSNNKLSPTDPHAIQFFNYELPMADGAPLIVSWLMDTSNNGQPKRSLATLTADVCQFYERAGIPDLDNRISYAEQVATFVGANPLPPNPSGPPITPPPVIPPVVPPVIPPITLPPLTLDQILSVVNVLLKLSLTPAQTTVVANILLKLLGVTL